MRKLIDLLLALVRRLFGSQGGSQGGSWREISRESSKPAPPPLGSGTPESKKPTEPPVSSEEEEAPDEPGDEVDDPSYDLENETNDDHTPRDPLPEPEKDTLKHVEEGMAPQAAWKERQRWLMEMGFDPGPVDGKPGPKTQTAVKEFQKSRGLEADGMWGPKTQRGMATALRTAGKVAPPVFTPPSLTRPKPYKDDLGPVELDDEFWACFVDLTKKSNVKDDKGRRRRKGKRKWAKLVRTCWHQTAFTWKPYRELKAKRKWSSHHKINAHVCFDTDGAVLLLHNFMHYLWTANSFNSDCLSFEIMGNFEGVLGTGNWYKPDKFGRGRPTRLQLVRCRQFMMWLLDPEQGPPDGELSKPLLEWREAVRELGYNPLKWTNAHRQSTDDRELDCGSECWYRLVLWTAYTRDAMSVGPERGDGMKIPDEWARHPTVPPLAA